MSGSEVAVFHFHEYSEVSRHGPRENATLLDFWRRELEQDGVS